MKLQTLQELRKVLADKLRELDSIKTNCMGCAHFLDGRTCAKWQAVPPVEFRQEHGKCSDWEYDRVPF